jgi:hypothetical protein
MWESERAFVRRGTALGFNPMKKYLLAATAACALVVSSDAWAENIAIAIENAANPGGVVTASGTDNVFIGAENLSGVTVDGTIGTRSTGPNGINGAQLLITNTTGLTQTLDFAVGAIGYVGSDNEYVQSATINLQSGTADLTGGYFVDALDRQMATSDATTTFGVENATFDSLSLTGPRAFSFNNTAFTPNSGPLFSMGEVLQVTLGAGAVVGVQGISMDALAVPETSTWVMAIAGFALCGLFGYRKRLPRYAV